MGSSSSKTNSTPLSSGPIAGAQRNYSGGANLLEEETLSWYDARRFYPVRVGETFKSRYQVLLKLGYGSVSTVWLCRDLKLNKYVSLKAYMSGHRQASNEIKVTKHLDSIRSDHPGSNLVSRALDMFEIRGESGSHVCIVHRPLSISLRDARMMAGGQIPSEILRPLLYGLLLGLDYLHSVAHVVHTDLQECNIMLAVDSNTYWKSVIEAERLHPSPCKVIGNRTIYSSVQLDMPDDPGDPIICDFGESQIGSGPFRLEVMPDLYRAPELVLSIPWNDKIDIWCFACLIWDLVEGKPLVNQRLHGREASRAAHLSEMIALLGPPPNDLLTRSNILQQFFDKRGILNSNMEHFNTTLEQEDAVFNGAEKAAFLAFMRKMLRWWPEDRASAKELLKDRWLLGQASRTV